MILIADEPTGNLNPKTAMEIMEIFENINKMGTTIIMATHAKEIVDAMEQTGAMMSPTLKESSQAGLATTKTGLEVQKRVFG